MYRYKVQKLETLVSKETDHYENVKNWKFPKYLGI